VVSYYIDADLYARVNVSGTVSRLEISNGGMTALATEGECVAQTGGSRVESGTLERLGCRTWRATSTRPQPGWEGPVEVVHRDRARGGKAPATEAFVGYPQ